MVYAFSENYLLPLSHDEVVHGKGSLFGMMTGDEWQKYANLRLLFGYMYAQPGKKLLFMGDELAQWPEWNHESSLEWHTLNHRFQAGVQKWVADLNQLYRTEPALHELDFTSEGFEWIDNGDAKNTTLSFLRKAREQSNFLLAVCNFHSGGPPQTTRLACRAEVLEGIAEQRCDLYGGSGQGNNGGVHAQQHRWHARPWSINLTLPPLATLLFVSQTNER